MMTMNLWLSQVISKSLSVSILCAGNMFTGHVHRMYECTAHRLCQPRQNLPLTCTYNPTTVIHYIVSSKGHATYSEFLAGVAEEVSPRPPFHHRASRRRSLLQPACTCDLQSSRRRRGDLHPVCTNKAHDISEP